MIPLITQFLRSDLLEDLDSLRMVRRWDASGQLNNRKLLDTTIQLLRSDLHALGGLASAW